MPTFHALALLLLPAISFAAAADSQMITAIKQGNPSAVEQLVQGGYQVNKALDAEGKLPIHLAVAEGKLPVARKLIELGANVIAPAEKFRKWTPLHFVAALQKDQLGTELAGALLKAGAKTNLVDADGKEALHLAVEKGNRAVVEFLLNRGVSPNTPVKGGLPPLGTAITARNLDLAQLLMSKGADAREKVNGGTYMHLFASIAGTLPIDKEIAHYLIKNGVDIRAEDASGTTALQKAVKAKNVDLVRALLYYKASASDFASNGQSALTLAIREKNYDFVQMMMQQETTDPKKANADGVSAVTVATGDQKMLGLLVKKDPVGAGPSTP